MHAGLGCLLLDSSPNWLNVFMQWRLAVCGVWQFVVNYPLIKYIIIIIIKSSFLRGLSIATAKTMVCGLL
jgi:hypothetical protein